MTQHFFDHGTRLGWFPGVPGLDGLVVTVVGISNTGMAVLGVSYIVELPLELPTYPYTHCVAFEIHLKEIE